MLAFLLSLPEDLGQAGGGGGFGGGGGGGGGFSGGGGGGYSGGSYSGGGEFSLGWFVFIVLIYVVIIVIKSLSKGEQNKRVSRTIRQGVKVAHQHDIVRGLEAIRSRDEAFTSQMFLDRVCTAFVATQYAWSEQDLTPSRAFISDGIHERFELYIAMQRHEDIRNRMRDVSIVNRQIVAVESDAHFDTIHVQFTARAISYNESLTTGRRVSGNSDQHPITFTEVWSFSRRPGVATRTDASLYEGSCPNCGDQLRIVDRVQCSTCESFVNSGAYDWVLTEITQHEEWIVPATLVVPGFDELAAADPGLNRQHLEDRTSVVYWRIMMAIYFGDLDYSAPVLAPGAAIPPRIAPSRSDRYWFTPAVGSVELLQVRAGSPGGSDMAYVQVRWSATEASGDRKSPQMHEVQRIHTDVLVLTRRSGVTSNAERSFSSFSCTNCGGPLDTGRATECRFCGTAINDGSTDWILSDVVPIGAVPPAPAASEAASVTGTAAPSAAPPATPWGADVAPAGSPPPPAPNLHATTLSHDHGLLLAVAAIAGADGTISPAERAELQRMGERRGIAAEHMAEVIDGGVSTDDIVVPTDPQSASDFLGHLVNAAFLDGLVTADERDILHIVGTRIGWPVDRVDQLIAITGDHLRSEAERLLSDPPPDPDWLR